MHDAKFHELLYTDNNSFDETYEDIMDPEVICVIDFTCQCGIRAEIKKTNAVRDGLYCITCGFSIVVSWEVGRIQAGKNPPKSLT